MVVLLIKKISRFFISKVKGKSLPKTKSVISLLTSIFVFVIYFLAIGYILKELGISLTAYIASASVIGLAVGFGSQGVVQDVVTGFTLIISNQIDVGDMVEINGQTGIVDSIDMRFVVFENALGAKVYIPNRNINVVINYPKKYVSCHVDIVIPGNTELKQGIVEITNIMLEIVPQKYPAILVQHKAKTKIVKTNFNNEILRVQFNIWPGRGTPIETTFKQELFQVLKAIDPNYADWMISVNYEIEKETLNK